MNINLYIANKIKNKDILDAIKEYSKRLRPYCKFNIIILKSNLKDLLAKSQFSIQISENFHSINSFEFSEIISKNSIIGISSFDFFITDDITNSFDFNFSLTYSDFNEEFLSLIFIEQIYRAFKIINNEPYHK